MCSEDKMKKIIVLVFLCAVIVACTYEKKYELGSNVDKSFTQDPDSLDSARTAKIAAAKLKTDTLGIDSADSLKQPMSKRIHHRKHRK